MFKRILASLGMAMCVAACCPNSQNQTASTAPACPITEAQGATATPGKAPAGATDDEDALYHLGYNMGINIRQFDLTEKEKEAFRLGFIDSLSVGAPEPDMREIGPKIQKFANSRNNRLTEKNHALGKAYLEKVAAEPGAEKTADGYVIQTLVEGTGPSPVASDKVKVHYTGTLIDGSKFDSSYDRPGANGEPDPAIFPLFGVIKCWEKGLQKMKVGGKSKLICPPDLAYGDRSRPKIPGGSTLVFDVELLEIMTPPPQKPLPSATGIVTVGGDDSAQPVEVKADAKTDDVKTDDAKVEAKDSNPEVKPNSPRPIAPSGPGGIPQNPPGEPQWRK